MSTKNSVRVFPKTIVLAESADGKLSGTVVVEVVEGKEAKCVASAGLQLHPKQCKPGSTTVAVTANGKFHQGNIEIQLENETVAQVTVKLSAGAVKASLSRAELINTLSLPLPNQPSLSDEPLALTLTPFEEVAIVTATPREHGYDVLKLALVVLNLKTWRWKLFDFYVSTTGGVVSSELMPRLAVVLDASELVISFTQAYNLTAGQLIYKRVGNGATLELSRDGAVKRAGAKSIAANGKTLHAEIFQKTTLQYDAVSQKAMLLFKGTWQCLTPGDRVTAFAQECDFLCSILARDANARARAALQQHGKNALPFIAGLLRPQVYQLSEQQYTAVRLTAAEMLAASGDTEVINDLWWATYDQCPQLRKAASQHLARFPLVAVQHVLCDLLRHIDDEIRVIAATALKPSQTKPEVRQALLESASRFPTTAKQLMDVAFP